MIIKLIERNPFRAAGELLVGLAPPEADNWEVQTQALSRLGPHKRRTTLQPTQQSARESSPTDFGMDLGQMELQVECTPEGSQSSYIIGEVLMCWWEW